MKKVAVLIDGGFATKIIKNVLKRPTTTQDVMKLANAVITNGREELFRVYFYDCAPFEGAVTNPISNITKDYSQTPLALANKIFFNDLAQMDYVALRRGEVRVHGWKLADNTLKQLNAGQFKGAIQAGHITPDFAQKGVDVRIGLDMAWLASRRIVDKVVLVTADTDFIPAMKFARKEGLHVAIAKITAYINDELKKHADFVISIDITKI